MEEASTTRVIVHYNGDATEIHPADDEETFGGESWGLLCQRFVETKLLHPPRLLQLLASLHPKNRMSSYVFRYGDGNSTRIEPTWSENGLNSGAAIVSGKERVVEANVTLRPRGTEVCDSLHCPGLGVAGELRRWRGDGTSVGSDGFRVNLCIEKVGESLCRPGRQHLLHPLVLYDDDDNSGFPLTQTPFPVDASKTRVLLVKEHNRFRGVVDEFRSHSAVDCGSKDAKHGRRDENRRGSPSPPVGGKKRLLDPVAAAVTELPANPATKESLAGPIKRRVHEHGDGVYRCVPSTWTFPNLPIQQLYIYWHCGDKENDIPPMKYFRLYDVDFLHGRSKLREIRKVMDIVDREARAHGAAPKRCMSRLHAYQCYAEGESAIRDIFPADVLRRQNPPIAISQLSYEFIAKYCGKVTCHNGDENTRNEKQAANATKYRAKLKRMSAEEIEEFKKKERERQRAWRKRKREESNAAEESTNSSASMCGKKRRSSPTTAEAAAPLAVPTAKKSDAAALHKLKHTSKKASPASHYAKYVHKDGKLRRVPDSWTFPELKLREMYIYWQCGDEEKKIAPMKFLDHCDVDFLGDEAKGNLRAIQKVMGIIDEEVRAQGVAPKYIMTTSEANSCYAQGECTIERSVAVFGPKQRRKRVAEMAPQLVYKYLWKNGE